MISIEEAAQKFHELDGLLLGQRKKSFRIYLAATKKLVTSPEDQKKLVQLITPTNHLENVFYTQLLLKFQQNEALLDILQKDNGLLRKMVLKSDSFLKNNLDYVTTDDFSRRICYIVRLRLFIRLGLLFQDEDKLDQYFEAMRLKYGIRLAKHLLPACKLTTIKEEMKKYLIHFNNKELTKIYKRFPDFLEDYFEHLQENNFNKFGEFDKLIRHVASTNLELYFRLLQKHELKTKLSISSTTKLMDKYNEEILKNGEKYIEVLHKNAAFKRLTLEEFQILYSKLFPNFLTDFKKELVYSKDKDLIKCLTKRAPKKLQFTIMNDTFKKLYKSDMLSHDELFSEDFLEIVPSDLRDVVITKKIAKDKKDDWLAFHELEKAQSVLRNKISKTTDPTKRRSLVVLLVKSCLVNKNLERLVEVFEYINARHRNEDAALFNSIFQCMLLCDLKKFSGEHWKHISEMLRIFQVSRHNEFNYSEDLLNRYYEGDLAYKIKENLPIEEDVTKYLKMYYKDYHLMLFRSKEDSENHKLILGMCAEMIPKLFINKQLKHVSSFFLQSIADFNENNPKDKLEMTSYDFVVKYIVDVMDSPKDEDFFEIYIIHAINHLKGNPEVYKKVCKRIWETKPEEYDHHWNYFLKEDPQYVVDYYHRFFEHSWTNKRTLGFIEACEYYSHLGIPELYKKKAKEILSNSDLSGESYKYKSALHYLANSEDFLTVIDRFIPKEDYEDASEEGTNIVVIKKTIGAVFGTYKNPEDILQPLLSLAKSDYLKYCLKSIYKVAYNLPESKLSNFMQKMNLGNNCLSKHVFYITCSIYDSQKVYETLKTLGKLEEDYTKRKCLLKSTVDYFNSNPSEEFFELVKDHSYLLNIFDTEAFDLILNFRQVPIKYLMRFVGFVWEYTQQHDKQEIRDLKYKILENLNQELMVHFSEEFLNDLVKNTFSLKKTDAVKIYHFIYRYIIFGNVENVADRIKLVISQFGNNISEVDFEVSKNELNFTSGFCTKILEEHKECNKNISTILETFTKSWGSSRNIENNFDQYVYLELTKYYINTDSYNQGELVQQAKQLLRNLSSTFGVYIIPNVASIFIKSFLTFIKIQQLQDDDELYKFILELLKVSQESDKTENEYFALHCLPKIFPQATNAAENLLKILKMLVKSESSSVRINALCYINNKEDQTEKVSI